VRAKAEPRAFLEFSISTILPSAQKGQGETVSPHAEVYRGG
jgi:hypothetical protein